MNAATKLLFPQNGGNFLTGRETVASQDELCCMEIVVFFTNVEIFGKYFDPTAKKSVAFYVTINCVVYTDYLSLFKYQND